MSAKAPITANTNTNTEPALLADDVELLQVLVALDGALIMKSLHPVPMGLLDRAMQEVRRVLKPGGWLFVSELLRDVPAPGAGSAPRPRVTNYVE